MGRKLILELGLNKYLGLDNLDSIVLCDDIIGEPNRVMGDVCDDYDNYNELDWII